MNDNDGCINTITCAFQTLTIDLCFQRLERKHTGSHIRLQIFFLTHTNQGQKTIPLIEAIFACFLRQTWVMMNWMIVIFSVSCVSVQTQISVQKSSLFVMLLSYPITPISRFCQVQKLLLVLQSGANTLDFVHQRVYQKQCVGDIWKMFQLLHGCN